MPKIAIEKDVDFHNSSLPYPLFSKIADKIIAAISTISHLSWIALIVVIIINVVTRYIFGFSIVAFEELQWHLYAIGFIIGLSYCLIHDQHVRVDVLAERWSLKTRALIDILAMGILLIPFTLVIFWDSISFVEFSYKLNEVSRSPGGLTHRWIIKAFLPAGFLLLCLAALSRMIRMIAVWRA